MDRETLTNIVIPSLNEINSHICEVTKTSEREFSAIASALIGFSKKSKLITSNTLEVASFLSGRDIREKIEDFNDLLGGVSFAIERSNQKIESQKEVLKTIAGYLDHSVEELDGFHKIVKQLRMLGISTKIESTRLRDSEHGFVNIADSVEKLSNIIASKANEVKIHIFELQKKILSVMTAIRSIEELEKSQFKSLLKGIEQNLLELTKRYELASDRMRSLSLAADNITSSIHNVVTSIQYQDITRQQLEHIEEAFGELLQAVKSEMMQADYDVSSLLRLTNDISRLQYMQAENSKKEIIEAIDTMTFSLTQVKDQGLVMFKELNTVLINDSGNEASFFKHIKDDLNQSIKLLMNNEKIEDDLSEAVKSVTETVTSLGEFVEQIDIISCDVELIAMNSLIKAAHTGNDGATLGVVSQAIQRLSSEARNQSNMISENLHLVFSKSNELSNNIDEKLLEQSSDNLLNRIEALSDFFMDTENSCSLRNNDIFNTVKILTDEIDSLLAKLEGGNKITGAVDQLLKKIDTIVEKSHVNEYEMTESSVAAMNKLKSKYTMASERKIHDGLAPAGNSEEDIILF